MRRNRLAIIGFGRLVRAFAARVMLDAARRLSQLRAGAHPYSLWL
jgi:hypothetical protein